MGDGGSEIIADIRDFSTRTSSADQALQTAVSKAAEQLSSLGSTEAVVFLRRSEYQPNLVEDTSLKANEAEWRQHTAQLWDIFHSRRNKGYIHHFARSFRIRRAK